jgi:hypothetical protein
VDLLNVVVRPASMPKEIVCTRLTATLRLAVAEWPRLLVIVKLIVKVAGGLPRASVPTVAVTTSWLIPVKTTNMLLTDQAYAKLDWSIPDDKDAE